MKGGRSVRRCNGRSGWPAVCIAASSLAWALALVSEPAFAAGTPASAPPAPVHGGVQKPTVVAPEQLRVVGDGVPRPLSPQPGDAARGRAIVVDRQRGLCLLCHVGPFPEERFQGNLAPTLAGVGSRYDPAQLRLRMVDPARLNPDTIMPSYYRLQGLQQVGASWRGKTVLDAQEVEDVIALLMTLKD